MERRKLLLIWFIIEKEFEIRTISVSLGVAIGFILTMISYISLTMKTNLIISTIDHLQEFVEKSSSAATLIYFVISAVSIGFFISLPIYVKAFSKDLDSIISD